LIKRKYALFGLLGPLIGIFFVLLSIFLSPWFSWWSNALSDLGHSINSEVAPLFNFGLILSGFFIMFYAITSLKYHAKYTSYILVMAGLTLQLVATFNEVYGFLHFLVSVLFFITIGLTSIIYAIEKRSVLAFAALIIVLSSWILYWFEIYSGGIAIPEMISSTATSSWILVSALRTIKR